MSTAQMSTPQISLPSANPFLFGAPTQAAGLGAQSGMFSGPGLGAPRMRADTPQNLQAGVEPLLSTAVLLLGTPQWINFFGSVVATDILKAKWRMGYWTWTNNNQLQTTTEGLERGFSVERVLAKFSGARRETELTRRGIETPLDVDEILIADGALRLAANAALLSLNLIRLDVEFEKSQLFGPDGVANYPVGHSADLTGSEWDAVGGDSLTDITAAVDQLVAANPPYQRESIHAVITPAAREAAKGDPTWQAARQAARTEFRPTTEDIARYWDLGRVTVADAIHVPPTGGLPISMWGATALLMIDQSLQGGIRDEWGRQTFAVNFTFNGGVISAPYFWPKTTSTFYPADSYDKPVLISPEAGFLLFNVKA